MPSGLCCWRNQWKTTPGSSMGCGSITRPGCRVRRTWRWWNHYHLLFLVRAGSRSQNTACLFWWPARPCQYWPVSSNAKLLNWLSFCWISDWLETNLLSLHPATLSPWSISELPIDSLNPYWELNQTTYSFQSSVTRGYCFGLNLAFRSYGFSASKPLFAWIFSFEHS